MLWNKQPLLILIQSRCLHLSDWTKLVFSADHISISVISVIGHKGNILYRISVSARILISHITSFNQCQPPIQRLQPRPHSALLTHSLTCNQCHQLLFSKSKKGQRKLETCCQILWRNKPPGV